MNGYYNYKDELYHHGVLGMKWGVRRYQSYSENPKLSNRKKRRLEKEAKKLEKKRSKELKREALNKSFDYGEDFDKTNEGKKLLKDYEKNIKILEDKLLEPGDKGYDEFVKSEEKYLRGRSRHEAEKLLNDYGEEDFKIILKSLDVPIKDGKDLVKQYEDDIWWRHTY